MDYIKEEYSIEDLDFILESYKKDYDESFNLTKTKK